MATRQNITGTPMKRFLLPIAVSLFVAPVCLAEGVYKCTSEAGVTYQSVPCTDGFTKLLVVPPLDKVEPRPAADGVTTQGKSAATIAPRQHRTDRESLKPLAKSR